MGKEFSNESLKNERLYDKSTRQKLIKLIHQNVKKKEKIERINQRTIHIKISCINVTQVRTF